MANNLTIEKKTLAVSMLCEGTSIRAIERMTGVHRDTVMRLGVRVGEACNRIHNDKVKNLDSKNIEVDEIWGFIGKKKKNTQVGDRVNGIGDAWTFIARMELQGQNWRTLCSDPWHSPNQHSGRCGESIYRFREG